MFDTATEGDLQDLVAIDQASQTPWTLESFRGELALDPPTLFVLRNRERSVAFIVIRTHGPDLDIVNLAVDRDKRRLGYGRTLAQAVLDRAAARGVRKAFLEVREGNQAARRLYRSLGFEETQRRRGFYRDPVEGAILMGLEIGP